MSNEKQIPEAKGRFSYMHNKEWEEQREIGYQAALNDLGDLINQVKALTAIKNGLEKSLTEAQTTIREFSLSGMKVEDLNLISEVLDQAINSTPTGKTRNSLCDLNIKVKTWLSSSSCSESIDGQKKEDVKIVGVKVSERSHFDLTPFHCMSEIDGNKRCETVCDYCKHRYDSSV